MADNETKPWTQEVGEPLEVSIKLVSLVTDLYKQTAAEDETLDVIQALES